MADTQTNPVDPTDEHAEDILESLGLHPAQLKVQEHLANLADQGGAQPAAAAVAPAAPPHISAPTAEATAPPKLAAPMPGAAPPISAKRPSMFSQGEQNISHKHPFWGGVLKGLDVAGSILAPGAMQVVPGTMLNERIKETRANNTAKAQREADKETADIEHTKAETENLGNKDASPEQQAFSYYTSKGMNPADAYGKIVELKAGGKTDSPEVQAYNQYLKQGMNPAEAFKAVQQSKQDVKPEKPEDDQKYESILQKKLLKQPVSPEDSAFASAYEKRKTLGTQITVNAANARAEKAGERQLTARDERRIDAHDKAYVQPAEAVEKSYEMMDNAYKEYKDAAAQGKTLPTGAQSMLALSTHLSTTFGNVKGARITKDMIQEHLGARSISDAATVAIQKLTNGDVLSPAQWDAFHDLIKQSRDLSWQTAVKEAKRKNIPVDFLPNDLKGTAGGEGSGNSSVPDPQTHSFSIGAWQRANPQGDAKAARKAAKDAGYTITD